MEHTLKNKKGMSMPELIAYVALYGVVMSLLASLVFVIVSAARKVNAQSIMNRGATLLYTEILSQTVSLNPDSVTGPTINGDTISITFEKVYYYDADGTRQYTSTSSDYANKITKIIYSYEKGADKINIKYVKGSGSPIEPTSTINLDYKMTMSSHANSEDISTVFSVVEQNKSNKYVTFHGDLHYDKKTMEFNFIVPVFTYSD